MRGPGQTELLSFDTNAWSNLLGDGLLARASLHALRRQVATRAVQVAVSWPLVMELTGAYDHKRTLWNKSIREFHRLAGSRILLERPARAIAEVRLGRPLRKGELFYPTRNSIRFLERIAAGENVLAEAEHVRRTKAEYAAEEAISQKAVRGEFASEGRAQWVKAWRENPSAIVEDWAHDTMEKILGSRQGLTDPRRLPSVWHRSAFHLARIYLVGVEAEGPGKIDANDMIDHDHYVDAGYSSVLVTDDERFHRIAAHCPKPSVRLVRFSEWAARIASG
jgi:hypothetical protein